jgi:hypothetical protein
MTENPVSWTAKGHERCFPMQLTVDIRQPIQQTTGSPEPSHPWILGLVAVDDDTRAAPGGRPYSFLSECECPDDCLRDHENE